MGVFVYCLLLLIYCLLLPVYYLLLPLVTGKDLCLSIHGAMATIVLGSNILYKTLRSYVLITQVG